MIVWFIFVKSFIFGIGLARARSKILANAKSLETMRKPLASLWWSCHGQYESTGFCWKSSHHASVQSFFCGWTSRCYCSGNLSVRLYCLHGWCIVPRIYQMHLRYWLINSCTIHRFDCDIGCEFDCDRPFEGARDWCRILRSQAMPKLIFVQ